MTQKEPQETHEVVLSKSYAGSMVRPDKLYRAKGAIPDLLFNLLHQATPAGTEDRVHPCLPPRKEWHLHDKEGNIVILVGDTKKHKTIFTSHMDTVHAPKHPEVWPLVCENGFIWGSRSDDEAAKKQGYKKNDYHDPNGVFYYKSSVLGADDKVGMYIMLRLIQNKTPGTYVFHTGEEKGGVGSKFFVENSKDIIKDKERVISFDRKGYSSVITNQRGGRCCSDKFADALCKELNRNLPAYVAMEKDVGGTFTDSANYTEIIGECTNLSVGYWNQHTDKEHFDPIWLEMYIKALFDVDWSSLPVERKPEPRKTYNNYNYNSWSSTSGSSKKTRSEFMRLTRYTPLDEVPFMTCAELEKICSEDKSKITEERVAKLLAGNLFMGGVQELSEDFTAFLLRVNELYTLSKEKNKSLIKANSEIRELKGLVSVHTEKTLQNCTIANPDVKRIVHNNDKLQKKIKELEELLSERENDNQELIDQIDEQAQKIAEMEDTIDEASAYLGYSMQGLPFMKGKD